MNITGITGSFNHDVVVLLNLPGNALDMRSLMRRRYSTSLEDFNLIPD